jgi:photosystem II stability/assembly factor-like uncharacterized protein
LWAQITGLPIAIFRVEDYSNPDRCHNVGKQAICAADVDACYAAGGVTLDTKAQGAIAKSMDGGASWARVYTIPLASTNSWFKAVNHKGTGFCAVGDNGSVAVLRPGQTEWEQNSIQPSDKENFDMNAVSFADANSGWAVGQNGKILKY